MADRSVEQPGPPYQADKRIVNPTLVTPGPQPIEAGDAVIPHILQGEVIGPRHARTRRRGVDPRRKAAAGAILLSATGAATALFMLMGKDARQAEAAPGHDSSSAVPDEPEPKAAAFAESAVGDKPMRGSRTSEPAAPAPAAEPTTRAPAAPAAGSGTPSSGQRSEPSRSWPSRAAQWQERAEAWKRWAEQARQQQAEQPANGQGGAPGQGQGQGQGRWGNGQGNGGGNGSPGGGSGPYGQGSGSSGPYGGGGQGGHHGGGPSR